MVMLDSVNVTVQSLEYQLDYGNFFPVNKQPVIPAAL